MQFDLQGLVLELPGSPFRSAIVDHDAEDRCGEKAKLEIVHRCENDMRKGFPMSTSHLGLMRLTPRVLRKSRTLPSRLVAGCHCRVFTTDWAWVAPDGSEHNSSAGPRAGQRESDS